MKKNKIQPIIIFLFLIILSSISIAVTVTGSTSSYSFTVNNCTATPMTNLTCDASTIRYECTIGNEAFIDYVEFRIEGTNYLTTQNSTTPTQFYLYYNKPTDTISSNEPLTFDRQTITDVDNKKVNANLFVEINKTCETCEANFVSTPIDYCQTNNTQLYQYISSNETCQPSYNISQTCDYCQPYLIANTTSCNLNNTQTTTYEDLNMNTCCQATLLSEDCPSLYYPYNQPTTTTCEYYQEDFTCNIDQAPIIDNKINLNCELPEEDACCVINIYQNQNTTRTLLQTSPEYKTTTNIIFAGETETRTCFQTNNRLLNAYYTEKELRPDTEYELEILCTTPTSSYRTITSITPVYKTPDEPLHRIKWVGDNPVLFIMLFIIAIIIIAIIIYLIGKIRGR